MIFFEMLINHKSASDLNRRTFAWRLKPNKPPVLPGGIKTLVYEKITSDDRMVKDATFEEQSTTTGSGTPVLIVITNESNNNGYYNGDYYDPTAYWVKDNVLYTLRVLGDESEKESIQATLERILSEI